MKSLSIDLETFCDRKLAGSGVYPYARDPSFEILLFSYSQDDEPVKIVDLTAGQQVPPHIVAALSDPSVTKWAYNAQFERVCLSAWLGLDGYLDPRQWRCSMIWGAYLGLPMGLEAIGKVLGLKDQKLEEGRRLVRKFCQPQPDSYRIARHNRETAPKDWEMFKRYNKRDVEVELEIKNKIKPQPMPASEWDLYHLDQVINDTGVKVDAEFAAAAQACDTQYKSELIDELKALTGLDNPSSVSQLLAWLKANGYVGDSLAKKEVFEASKTAKGSLARVLELRAETSRTSTKKYVAMRNAMAPDGRAHGLMQFYGAGKTGRWAGRLIQVQNLPRNDMALLSQARQLVALGHVDDLEMIFGSVSDVLRQLVRTALVPSDGKIFAVADFSAIEARVLAWLAGQESTLKAFKAGKDLYCHTASGMFGVPVVKHGVNGELRQKGKIATLACGYGGSVGALKAMGALEMGLAEEELAPIVANWRQANPRIVDYWGLIEAAAIKAVGAHAKTQLNKVAISYRKPNLVISLPSGRELFYPNPRLGANRFGGTSIVFDSVNQVKQWGAVETYGGKLTENIVQAVARDLLAFALTKIAGAGYKIVFHVHDEVVVETEPNQLDRIIKLMCASPEWAEGLPLDADGYTCSFYQKD